MAELRIDTITPPADTVAGRKGRWGWFRFEMFVGSSDVSTARSPRRLVPTRRSFGQRFCLDRKRYGACTPDPHEPVAHKDRLYQDACECVCHWRARG